MTTMAHNQESSLDARFEQLATRLGATRGIEATSERLLAKWREGHRLHHGVTYLEEGLARIDTIATSLEEPLVVEAAWWFHKADLRTGPFADTARRSADFAYDACRQMGIGRELAERLRRMIRATETHLVPKDMNGDRACAALVDLDLAVLGSDELTFARYERDLAKEAKWGFLEAMRLALRTRSLRGHLAREAIFVLPEMRAQFEAQARRNLRRVTAATARGPRAPRAPRRRSKRLHDARRSLGGSLRVGGADPRDVVPAHRA
jgi:predicted metal-dependent HD superfamily phosphohydrolase